MRYESVGSREVDEHSQCEFLVSTVDEDVNSTLHTSLFSRSQRALVMMCHTTLAQVFVRVIPSMYHALE